MDELGIIRSQLAVEQSHAREVVNGCAAVFGSAAAAALPAEATARFREACVSYLVWVLARFEERDQTLSELMGSQHPAADGAAAGQAGDLGGLIARSGGSREALSRLEAALAAGESPAAGALWREFAGFFNSTWAARRAALEEALAARLSIADWRAVSAIDADSILDERNRYARVVAHLPAGVPLREPPPPGAAAL